MFSDRRRGVTLIEVMGAMGIFSFGVLMVMSMTTSLSGRYQANTLTTNISIAGQTRLDSLAVLEYEDVSVGVVSDTMTISNELYTCTITVTQTDPVSRTVQVSLDPSDGVGPVFDGTTYVARVW